MRLITLRQRLQHIHLRNPAERAMQYAQKPASISLKTQMLSKAGLDRHLGAHFHDTAGRYLEEVGRVAGGTRKRNEQMILP